jgi:hypothetical protein
MSYNNIQRTITIIHDHVHDGLYFEIDHVDLSLANNGTINFHFEATDSATKEAHMTVGPSLDGTCLVEIYEDPTVDAAGTAQVPINRNYDSSTLSGWTVTRDSTYTDTGTKKATFIVPGGTGGASKGAVLRDGLERIFGPEHTYFVRITNKAGTAKVASLQCTWYEFNDD